MVVVNSSSQLILPFENFWQKEVFCFLCLEELINFSFFSYGLQKGGVGLSFLCLSSLPCCWQVLQLSRTSRREADPVTISRRRPLATLLTGTHGPLPRPCHINQVTACQGPAQSKGNWDSVSQTRHWLAGNQAAISRSGHLQFSAHCSLQSPGMVATRPASLNVWGSQCLWLWCAEPWLGTNPLFS